MNASVLPYVLQCTDSLELVFDTNKQISLL